MREKRVKFFVLYNIRNDDIRWRKTKPTPQSSPFDVVVPVELKFKLPDMTVETLKATIDIPEGEVEQMVTELIQTEEPKICSSCGYKYEEGDEILTDGCPSCGYEEPDESGGGE